MTGKTPLRLFVSLFFLLSLLSLAGCPQPPPLQDEICDNGGDDDGDGQADCDDTDCEADPSCEVAPACGDGTLDQGEECDGQNLGGRFCSDLGFSSGTLACAADCRFDTSGCVNQENCSDGIDNDNDGREDCQDTDCVGSSDCLGQENCLDGQDNDNDTQIDCDDAQCAQDAACIEQGNCADTLDNDQDSLVDCDDPDCAPDPACVVLPETCDNGLDDNGDGQIDCGDPDCALDPACAVGPDPNAADKDFDCDGLSDAQESAGNTDPADADSDDDGLLDGVELGRTDPVSGSNCAGFPGDQDPASTTDPNDTDSDNDGLLDGQEDEDRDGLVDANEADPTRADTDNDGLVDGLEGNLGTSPVNADSDNDGLSDGDEVNAGTNPLSTDSDCDAIADGQEPPLQTDPADADSDNDGLADGQEIGATAPVNGASCSNVKLDLDPTTTTDPTLTDTDGDLVSDGNEDLDRNGRADAGEMNPLDNDSDDDSIIDGNEDRDRNGLQGANETSPLNPDSDGDGLGDGVEDANQNGLFNFGETNPRLTDSDFDGILDGVEDANLNGLFEAGETDPRLFDTDGDTLSDGCEDRNQNGAVDPGEPDPRVTDGDQDGLPDNQEDLNRSCTLDATETDPGSSDTDCDGLSDLTEKVTTFFGNQRTDPLLLDSDGDGLADGVERGAQAPLANSDCASILIDLDPTTTTDPTSLDSDNDGRADGCEDGDQNGRVDAGELDPLAFDTDGDGLGDAQEDLNGNCALDAGETNADASDTDGDGIGDGVETLVGTDPTNADTDGDGLSDGVEDANQNGTVDLGETNAGASDTDGDGIPDGTEDANQNGTVDVGETDASDTDSDNDGLSDGDEVNNGTDPTSADNDGDGLTDAVEQALGTDPLDPDTDGDTLLDGDELVAGTDPLDPASPDAQTGGGINDICSAQNLKVVQFVDEATGDWTVALEEFYVYTPASVSGDQAATFQDNATNPQVAGLAMNIALPDPTGNAVTQAQSLLSRLTSGAGTLGASSVIALDNGRQIVSQDNFEAVVEVQVNFVLSTAQNPSSFRNQVMAVLSGRPLSDFSGLPAAGGALSAQYVLKFEALVRNDVNPARLIVLGALVSKGVFDNNNLTERFELEDLSNGTALAKAFSGDAFNCDLFDDIQPSQADFIFMADVSASTDNDRGNIADNAEIIFDALAANGVDFRVGVVPHHENDRNQGNGNGGDMRSGFLDPGAPPAYPNLNAARNQFVDDLNNTNGQDGCEFGLTAESNAIREALPRSAPGVINPLKLRDGALLVAFYISDEHAQELETNLGFGGNNNCGQGNVGTGLRDTFVSGNNHSSETPVQSAIDSLTAPFVSQIQNEGGISFAQIHPLGPGNECLLDQGNPVLEEEGFGYFDVATLTGGTFYRVCDPDPGTILQNIIDAVTGAASQFALSNVPISATIKVGVVRSGTSSAVEVPRSLVDGFDYDPAANTIFFRGGTFRPNAGDLVAVSYRVFTPPEPPQDCPPPLTLNPVTGLCECPADCGVGGCGVEELCNTDPAVCACECKADCGGICGGITTCDTSVCGCVCAPNCGDSCTGNFTCDQDACACQCPDSTPGDGANDCNGTCVGNQVCDTDSCACFCPLDCGGCPSGQVCNVIDCACEDAGGGEDQ